MATSSEITMVLSIVVVYGKKTNTKIIQLEPSFTLWFSGLLLCVNIFKFTLKSHISFTKQKL